ncbi:glycosyltransferase family 9 protein [Vibrio sp.]|nr:glycosyltransferase family 9 protein [Vibrio sp.]
MLPTTSISSLKQDALFNDAPASLCILRLSALGDVCNTIAVVQAIQKQWPQTKITWITGKLEAQLIHDLPNINVIIFDKKAGWSGYRALWQSLKHIRFDALLHMQYALRASIATLGIKATYKLGFDSERSQDFQTLFTNVKVPSPQQPHVLDGLMAFAHTLGIKASSPSWYIPYSEDDKQWALAQLSTEKPNVIIVPGTSKAYKNWTTVGYVDAADYAHSKGFHVLLSGSPAPNEVTLAQQIQAQSNAPLTNLAGQSSIKQMLALIDLADLVIAPDTGPTHMANAMQTPVIGLYAHHNPKRTGPYCYQDFIVSAYTEALKQEHPNGIDALPWRTRVKNEQAMALISTKMLRDAFDNIMLCYDLRSQINAGPSK